MFSRFIGCQNCTALIDCLSALRHSCVSVGRHASTRFGMLM